jgi:hypothetical protein
MCAMVTTDQISQLEAQADAYYAAANKISFAIENRQEELTGLLKGYAGLNDASAQVLRQYFLNGGKPL